MSRITFRHSCTVPHIPHTPLYEKAPSLYCRNVGMGRHYSLSTGEGGVGVIFIIRCAPIGHGG